MRIGIDATYHLHGGGRLHLREVLKAWVATGASLEHEIVVLTRQENISDLRTAVDSSVSVVPVLTAGAGTLRRLYWQQATLPTLGEELKLDVLFCPGNLAPLRKGRVPTVVMLQNAAPFCEAITPRSEGLKRWLGFAVLGWGMMRSARSATQVIYISDTLRKTLGRRDASCASKGHVVYLGREMDFAADPVKVSVAVPALRPPYILCVSHIYPYKNLSALIAGYIQERARLQALDLRLYIVGKAVSRKEYARLRRAVEQNGLEDWVVFTGSVPETHVAALFPPAEFVVFQSTCENCPSTLIEALSAGAPIACSNASSMPEIAEDAVFYFDPFSPRDIGAALVRIAEDADLRSSLRERARIRAKQFLSWSEVARLTLEILKSAAIGSSDSGSRKCVA